MNNAAYPSGYAAFFVSHKEVGGNGGKSWQKWGEKVKIWVFLHHLWVERKIKVW